MKRDRLLGRVDRGQHFVVGLAAGGQRRDAVAVEQRQVREPRDVFGERREVQRLVAEDAVQHVVARPAAAGGAVEHARRPLRSRRAFALNAIDAEGEVEDRADDAA